MASGYHARWCRSVGKTFRKSKNACEPVHLVRGSCKRGVQRHPSLACRLRYPAGFLKAVLPALRPDEGETQGKQCVQESRQGRDRAVQGTLRAVALRLERARSRQGPGKEGLHSGPALRPGGYGEQ